MTARKKNTPEELPPNNGETEEGPLLEGMAQAWMRFDRFGWDITGVSLLAIALITLLALLSLSEGRLITPWGALLRQWFGWGSYIAAFLIGILGLQALRQPFKKSFHINLGRILVFELWVFCLLALLAVLGGHSLENAENGLDGGIIGWGLAELVETILPSPWSLAVLLFLVVLLFLPSFGLIKIIGQFLERWLLAPTPQNDAAQISTLPIEPAVNGASGESVQTDPAAIPAIDEPIEQPHAPRALLPSLDLLLQDKPQPVDKIHIHETALKIEKTLDEFGVPARVTGFRVGPKVTQYAVEPGYIEKQKPDGTVTRQKVRVAQISGLQRDLERALSAERLRIEAPVPGYSFVGIEAPNPDKTAVRMRTIIESSEFKKLNSPLAITLGRNVSGRPVVVDLARMPHILIAGTTGSGKSICIQSLATCLIMNSAPDKLRLAMLDPKMVELVRFNGLPHLFGQVETDIERMLGVLRWAILEMENRYKLMEAAGARDLNAYNKRARRRKEKQLPFIVIFIDELADLMMSAPEQTEPSLVRLAQMARATGIHLIVATQRPSTDVITGLIKANFPARISFNVATGLDSRVILDVNGAEDLLGHGDLLFINPEKGLPERAQGVWVSDAEIQQIIEHWQQVMTESSAEEEEAEAPWEELLDDEETGDEMLDDAINMVRKSRHASASLLQRRLRVGYPRAARLIDEMEAMGVVGPSLGSGKERDVLIPPEDETEDEA
jgi:DNA segregation ATPase FtsK/SpoIIIE, S-DNA-T family